MADDVLKKLDELRRQAAQKLEEARAIVASMNTVETVFDLPLTVLADLETTVLTTPPPPTTSQQSGEPRSGPQQPKRRSTTTIRPDEYFGDEPMDAAKKFMRAVGHAVSFEEITDAVQKGGAAIKGADWRERLEISLKRSPYQVITVADKTYGLAEFYTEEQLKRFRSSRRGDEQIGKKKTKSKPKQKPKAKAVTTDTAKKSTQPSNTRSTASDSSDLSIAPSDEGHGPDARTPSGPVH